MPDFRAYVRRHLPPLGVSDAREAEIVEELALDFQESYERARCGGLDPEQAWLELRSHARPGPNWVRNCGPRLGSLRSRRHSRQGGQTCSLVSAKS